MPVINLTAKLCGAKLDYQQDTVTGYIKAFVYDTLGRMTQTGVSVAANDNYYQRVNYDPIGRVYQQYDASGAMKGTTNLYNAYGYLRQVQDATTAQPYYTAQAMDVFGHVTQELNGAVTTNRSYDPVMGRLTAITSTVVNLNTIRTAISTNAPTM